MRRTLILLLIIGTAFVVSCQQATAGLYIGGYLSKWLVRANRVHLATSLSMVNPGDIPVGGWIAGIASVAGANNWYPTGRTFQTGVAVSRDGTVRWAPQIWYGASEEKYLPPTNVGDVNWVAFHLRMDITANTVIFRCYAYHYPQQYGQSDAPVVYSWPVSVLEYNFLVGEQYAPHGERCHHFQFGIEASSTITTRWEIPNKKPCFYNGSCWEYYRGFTCLGGPPAAMTWIGQTTYWVGDGLYNGVNTDYVSNDYVEWARTGTTIPDDLQLWSGSGVVSDVVNRPYELY